MKSDSRYESEEEVGAVKNNQWFVIKAQELHHKEGEFEIDDNAPVSRGDDAGAYVQAWECIPDDDQNDGLFSCSALFSDFAIMTGRKLAKLALPSGLGRPSTSQ